MTSQSTHSRSEPGNHLSSKPAKPRVATSYLAAELYLRRELRRHFLSERERLVADALLEVSLGWGLEAVCIPKLDVIGELTGMARSHVHGALKGLFDMKILRIDTHEGIARYAFCQNTENWKVKIRCARADVNSAKELLLEVNHLARPDNLTELARIHAKPPTMPAAAAESSENPKDRSFFDRISDAVFADDAANSVTVTAERFPDLL